MRKPDDAMILGMTTRRRVALWGGLALLPAGLVVGCCLPLFLGPDGPWLDVERQGAEFERNMTWTTSIACALVVPAVLLLAYSLVDWRSERQGSQRKIE